MVVTHSVASQELDPGPARDVPPPARPRFPKRKPAESRTMSAGCHRSTGQEAQNATEPSARTPSRSMKFTQPALASFLCSEARPWLRSCVPLSSAVPGTSWLHRRTSGVLGHRGCHTRIAQTGVYTHRYCPRRRGPASPRSRCGQAVARNTLRFLVGRCLAVSSAESRGNASSLGPAGGHCDLI